jgi:hypothetical protein
MELPPFVNGTLLDVVGPARASGDFKFVPARIELNGNGYSSECYFQDHPAANALKADLAQLVEQEIDAIWVAARIMAEFGVNPLLQDMEKTSISIGFAAVSTSRSELPATLFYCQDYYLRTGLAFGDDEPPTAIRNDIAHAFWDLLLNDADNTNDFEASMYHIGAGVQIRFGCRGGVFEFREEN